MLAFIHHVPCHPWCHSLVLASCPSLESYSQSLINIAARVLMHFHLRVHSHRFIETRVTLSLFKITHMVVFSKHLHLRLWLHLFTWVELEGQEFAYVCVFKFDFDLCSSFHW